MDPKKRRKQKKRLEARKKLRAEYLARKEREAKNPPGSVCSLTLVGEERPGLLNDVSGIVLKNRSRITKLTATRHESKAMLRLRLEVPDRPNDLFREIEEAAASQGWEVRFQRMPLPPLEE